MKIWLNTVLVGCGAFGVFVAGISNPSGLMFDERLYVDAGAAVLAGTADPSPYGPPLGKLLVAASMGVFGNTPFGWRLSGALFGALTLAAVFLCLWLLLEDYTLALAGTALTLLDNFLFVLSRAAMMDIFLVGFAVWSVLGFVAALKVERIGVTGRRVLLLLGGIFSGCAIACKWNGVDELAVIVVLGAVLLLFPLGSLHGEFASCAERLRSCGKAWFAICMLVVPAVVYVATFGPLFRSEGVPFSRDSVVAANVYIWEFHRSVVGNIGLIVPWYKWPLMTQPTRALSYLVGNWYVMWVGLVALAYCAVRFGRNLPETLLVALYAANMLQWIVTPQPCVFYYYYFPAAMFLGMAIPVALKRLPERVYGVRLSVVAVLPAFAVFMYCFAHMAHLGAPWDTMLGYWT
jgi:dolichyl-phosphate-mannose-protein mannosyltransferase